MDKKTLQQLKFLEDEIKHLSKLAETYCEPVHDIVKGSMLEYPYINHIIKVEGINEPTIARKVERINEKIRGKLKELLDIREKAVDWIMAIEESNIRKIFTMRYIDGWTWEQVSNTFGSEDEQYARRIHDRYLKKIEMDAIAARGVKE